MTSYASFPLPRASVSTHVRFTQTLGESVAPPRRVTVTTGLFETHPHLLARPLPAEPAWKQEQRRVPRRQR